MGRPCGASGFCRACGEGSFINVFGLLLELLCSWPSWILARVRSHYRTGLNGPFGSPVFAGAGKTEPPSRLILSQTSAGNWTSCECSRGLKPRFKNAAVSQHAPGDARQLVGERD